MELSISKRNKPYERYAFQVEKEVITHAGRSHPAHRCPLCRGTKLSAGMLQQAMKKVLDEMQKGVTGHKTKLHYGKQTLRQLMKHNTGVSNIEITGQNIRAFPPLPRSTALTSH